MKRYLLFAGDSRYPQAGLSNLIGDYDSYEVASNLAFSLVDNQEKDWFQLVDSEIRRIYCYNCILVNVPPDFSFVEIELVWKNT